ncbi:MAG: ribosomal-processing cysteine protease Prp [Bacilli bacterium]|jgi:hypothetical protein|nr:ribosomal-processing cysteine protease Prp [Bacilli bacterium]
MININIKKENNNYQKIIIKGHANYEEKGKDIVCAAVSSSVITTINGLLSIDENSINYKQTEDNINIIVNNNNLIIQKLLDNMINMLKELEKDYPNYINTSEEVD